MRDQPEFGWPLHPAIPHTGSVSPDKFGGYKDYALAKYTERIKRWIAQQPDLTLLELQARLADTGVMVAASSVFRFLHHLGLTYKSPARSRTGLPGRGRHAPALAA